MDTHQEGPGIVPSLLCSRIREGSAFRDDSGAAIVGKIELPPGVPMTRLPGKPGEGSSASAKAGERAKQKRERQSMLAAAAVESVWLTGAP